MARVYQQGDEPVKGYRLIRFLGRGGCGEVWQAQGPGGTEVAFKIISFGDKPVGRDGCGKIAALHELEFIKRIRHPNLVPMIALWLCDGKEDKSEPSQKKDPPSPPGLRAHTLNEIHLADSGPVPEAVFLALGLAEKNLLDRFKECKTQGLPGIPAAELIGYVEDVARGLDHLGSPRHELGQRPVSLSHGNIKPQNILLVGGAAQVSDFGLARVLGVTLIGQAPAFAAPEILEEGCCSPLSDQYSLAVTYHYLRTGALPFSQNEVEVVMMEAREGRLDLTRLPEGEQPVIRRATNRRPESRFANCCDLARELRHSLETSVLSNGNGQESTPETFIIEPGREIVPGHKLVRLIGRGAYGEVWEAQAPGRLPIALKIIKELDQVGGRGRQEFRALEIIRQVAHNGLMELRAYWVLDRRGRLIPDEWRGQPGAPVAAHLIVATRLADRNMSQVLAEFREQGKPGVPPKELFGYLRQVASALDYLNSPIHPLGDRLVAIQHRDVKPDNIMITSDSVRLTDFGLAKVMENQETAAEIRQDSVGFTFHYAAPEVLRGKVTRWSDQYSLAITYFQLRSGTLPYGLHISAYDQMMRQLEGRLDLAVLPLAERRIVSRATHVVPEERFPTCAAFIEALASVVPNMGALLSYEAQAEATEDGDGQLSLTNGSNADQRPAIAVGTESSKRNAQVISTMHAHKPVPARPTMRITLRPNEIYPPILAEPHARPVALNDLDAQVASFKLVPPPLRFSRFWPLVLMFLVGIGMAVLVHWTLKWLDQKPSSQMNFQNVQRPKDAEPNKKLANGEHFATMAVPKPKDLSGPLPNNSAVLSSSAPTQEQRQPPAISPPPILGMDPQRAGFSEYLQSQVSHLIATCQTSVEFTNAYRALELVPQSLVTAQLLTFRAECQLEGENKNIMLADFWLKQALGLEEPTAYTRFVQARILQEAHQSLQAAQVLTEALKDDISLRGFRLKRTLAILDEAMLRLSGEQKERLQQLRNEVSARIQQ
jgi:serine/threonine protein kinase